MPQNEVIKLLKNGAFFPWKSLESATSYLPRLDIFSSSLIVGIGVELGDNDVLYIS